MQVTAKYDFQLPFNITLLSNEVNNPIELRIDDTNVIIETPLFIDEHKQILSFDLPKDNSSIEGPWKNPQIACHSYDKVIFNANLISIKVVKEIREDLETSKLIENLDKIAFDVLNRFLQICRWRGQMHWIDYNVTLPYVSEYVDANGKRLEYDVDGRHLVGLHLHFTASIPESTDNPITKVIWEQISSDLASKREVPLQQSLLLNAQNYISSKNYRLAIIEAVTALEIAISDFMKRSQSKSAVIQKRRYASLREKLEYVVKKLLPDNMKNEIEKQLSDSNVNLLNKCIDAIKERNCVVHQGDDIQADKISEYIEAIQRMIYYLDIA